MIFQDSWEHHIDDMQQYVNGMIAEKKPDFFQENDKLHLMMWDSIEEDRGISFKPQKKPEGKGVAIEFAKCWSRWVKAVARECVVSKWVKSIKSFEKGDVDNALCKSLISAAFEKLDGNQYFTLFGEIFDGYTKPQDAKNATSILLHMARQAMRAKEEQGKRKLETALSSGDKKARLDGMKGDASEDEAQDSDYEMEENSSDSEITPPSACRIAATVHGKRCVYIDADAKLFTYDFKTKEKVLQDISNPFLVCCGQQYFAALYHNENKGVGLKCKKFDGQGKTFDFGIGMMINAVKGACMYDNPKNLSIAVFGDGRLWIYYSSETYVSHKETSHVFPGSFVWKDCSTLCWACIRDGGVKFVSTQAPNWSETVVFLSTESSVTNVMSTCFGSNNYYSSITTDNGVIMYDHVENIQEEESSLPRAWFKKNPSCALTEFTLNGKFAAFLVGDDTPLRYEVL
jgi:hypothetical protein